MSHEDPAGAVTELVRLDDPDAIAPLYLADDRPPHESRPWVTMGMIGSVDGAVTVGGRSSGLGGPPDKAVFRALRAMADIVLVGGGTVRAERYRAVSLPDDLVEWRRRAGLDDLPRIAVVSRSLDLDMTDELRASRPIVLTTPAAPADRLARLGEDADVVFAGDRSVEPALALQALRGIGVNRLVLEGGPTLNGDFADLTDEVCLTISPMVVGGGSVRIVGGPERVRSVRPDRIVACQGFLLLRYLSG